MNQALTAAADLPRLAELDEYDILDTAPEPAFDDIVALACRLCDTPVALISFVDRDRQWFKARLGFTPTQTDLGRSVCAHAVASRELLIIDDLTADPRTAANPLVCGEPNIRFYAGAPLISPGGQVLGTLCVIDHQSRPGGLTVAQTEDLQRLARQVMSLLDMRRVLLRRGHAVLGARRDSITLRERLREHEADSVRLRETISSSLASEVAGGVGTFDLDLATDEVRLSAEACRLLCLPEASTYPMSAVAALVIEDETGEPATRTERLRGDIRPCAEYRLRRGGPDAALRWVARRGEVVRDETGAPVRFVGTLTDVTAQKLGERRQAALIAIGDALYETGTREAAITVAARLLGETLGAARAGVGLALRGDDSIDVVADWSRPGFSSLKGRHPIAALPGGVGHLRPGRIVVEGDLPVVPGGDVGAQIAVALREPEPMDGYLFVQDDHPRSWSRAEVMFVQSVADRLAASLAKRAAQAKRELLARELEHRMKNTLSVVQALASQTLRGLDDRGALDRLMRRLQALGKAHEVLLQESWSSAPIRPLVEASLSLHGLDDGRFEVSGPDMMLSPRATLSLSLLLHELGTNACKYGALSVPFGRVALVWQAVPAVRTEPLFTLRWTEGGGPPARRPATTGFGSRLIRGGLLGVGGAELDYAEAGLAATFSAPLAAMTDAS